MAHQRQLIREAIKTALVNANTSAGTRVYETRMVPFRKLELPAVAVYALEESVASSSGSSAPRELTRNLTIVLDAVAQPGSNVDDTMDALASELEHVMALDETFGGKCSDCILASTQIDIFEEGDKAVGLLKLTFNVTYYTYEPVYQDSDLDDLSTVDVKWNELDGTNTINAADQAEDTLTDLEE